MNSEIQRPIHINKEELRKRLLSIKILDIIQIILLVLFSILDIGFIFRIVFYSTIIPLIVISSILLYTTKAKHAFIIRTIGLMGWALFTVLFIDFSGLSAMYILIGQINIYLLVGFLVVDIWLFLIFRSKKRVPKLLAQVDLDKLKQMLRVSTKIRLDMMQDILGLSKKLFNEQIFRWANEFDFTIDGDYIVINKETVLEFINSLDQLYEEWKKVEEMGSGKIGKN